VQGPSDLDEQDQGGIGGHGGRESEGERESVGERLGSGVLEFGSRFWAKGVRRRGFAYARRRAA
jgi:hypothetical protein